MSYILDALKKSEQERGTGAIPGVQTIHSSSLNYNNQKTYWPYILIAAVLLNLVAILYFVFNKEDQTPADLIVSTRQEPDKAISDASSTATSNTDLNQQPGQALAASTTTASTTDRNILQQSID